MEPRSAHEEVPAEAPEPGPAPGTLSALLRDLAADEVAEAGWEIALAAGQEVGRFRLVRELGRGGFGVVFEAEDTQLRRRVALKAVRTGPRDELRSARLLEEAEAAARLTHPNILTLYDLGRSEHGPYLVLELLEGETLEARVGRGVVPPAEAVGVATGIARGLAHAHARGVVHRDLKPGNVFLTRDGGVKILDFGLAHAFGLKRVEGGTPAYAAPEQWAGGDEDQRTDVFALGAVLYRMLSGRLPFTAEELKAADGPAAPELEVAGLPALGQLVAAMLERDPAHRPRDGAEVQRALELLGELLRAAGPAAPGAGAVAFRRRTRRAWWRSRAAGAAAFAALVATAAGLGLLWRLAPREVAARGPERLVVAIADVENETHDPELDGLAGMIATSLEQSRAIEVLPRVRLVDLAGRDALDATGRLDADRTAAAASQAGAGALVVAVLRKLGDSYVADVRVTNPRSGARLLSLREQEAAKENLPDLLDRLSSRIRLGLGEDPAEVRETSIVLARAVTRSLEAWSHYARGQTCRERTGFYEGYGPCLEELRSAVRIDPEFALAHVQLSEVLHALGVHRLEQRAALEPALRLLDRIPRSQRLRVEGWRAFLDGEDAGAKRLLAEAARAAGDDKYAWRRAGEVPFHRDEFAEALPFWEKVSELDPAWPEAVQHLALALGAVGDRAGLDRLEARLSILDATPAVLADLCLVRLWQGRSGDALAACERAAASGEAPGANPNLAMTLLHRGERARLRALLGRMSDGSPTASFGSAMSLLLAAQEGRWAEARRQQEESRFVEQGAWYVAVWLEALAGAGDARAVKELGLRLRTLGPALATHVAPHLAYLGDVAGAAEFEGELPPGSPREATYRALVRWRQGDRAGAIAALAEVAERTPFSLDPAMPHPAFLLGEALVEAGRDAEAVAPLTRFLSFPLHYPAWEVPRALYHLAAAQERLGRLEEAREAARRLRAVWERADASQPLVGEARALWTRLGVP